MLTKVIRSSYHPRPAAVVAALVALATGTAACVGGSSPRPAHADTLVAGATVAAPLPAATSAAALRFVVAPSGNEARYRVREQLVGRDLPNDAVGATSGVTGAISVDAKGNVLPGESKFVVDVSALKSDKDRRDGYVRRRLLETDSFPTVTLVPKAVRGLPAKLPTAAATGTFELTGDLTVHGVTRPTTWRGTARYENGTITGSASTGFTFAEFGLTQPRVPVVLSVADTIRLEYDFTLVRDAGVGATK